ncbi:MAG: DnaJ domain-containing protein [Oscillospiraceae bacterium]|jgi:GGDEF domain-containing protein|nr:DnaJ domain-containing protein [Oscillospiraceae bacterium]
MNQPADYYKILQVRFGADKAAIISSYRRLCKLYHPDVNRDPSAEDAMKQINVAYSILCDDSSRAAYDNSFSGRARGPGVQWEARQRELENERAFSAIRDYFDALLNGAYEKAYTRLSIYDRQYVTLQSFCKWRKSVQRLFSIRECSHKREIEQTKLTLEDGRTVPAKRHHIFITEKNLTTQATESYQAAKFTICENGVWRVFLGYRDLNEIAKMFENLSARQEKGEMAKRWEEYCADMCRELDMFSLTGLLKNAERELYRCKRYNQSLVIALFRVEPALGFYSEEAMVDILESAAGSITSSLRETDIPAYLGKGRFAVLYIELKKRHAGVITDRLCGKIARDASLRNKTNIRVTCDFAPYSGGELKPYIDKLSKKAF